MKTRSHQQATIDFSCHVESQEKFQITTFTKSFQGQLALLVKVFSTPHMTTCFSIPVKWIDNAKTTQPGCAHTKSLPPASMTPPSPNTLTRPSFAQTVILIYLLYTQQSNTGPTEKFITSLATQHWSNPHICPEQVVKSQKSCFCWTRAIIKQLWDTAWDLITHQNVESGLFGFGLPTIKWKVTLYPLHSYRLSSMWMTSAPTVFWQLSQLRNPICYHSSKSVRL